MGTVGIANIESTYRARCCVDRNIDVRCDIERAEISEAAAVRDNSAAPVCSVAPVAVGIFSPRSIGIECRRRSGSRRWFRFTTLAPAPAVADAGENRACGTGRYNLDNLRGY